MSTPEHPKPIDRNGRKFFVRSQLEAFKRALAGLPPVENDDSVIELVPAPQAAKEFGVSRRTLGRRMAATAEKVA